MRRLKQALFAKQRILSIRAIIEVQPKESNKAVSMSKSKYTTLKLPTGIWMNSWTLAAKLYQCKCIFLVKVLNYSNKKSAFLILNFDRYHSHKCKSDLPPDPIVLLPKRPSVTVCLCALPLWIHTWWSTVTVTSQDCSARLKNFKKCNSPMIFWERKCHIRCVKFCSAMLCFTTHHTRPGHSDKPFDAPKPYTRPLTGKLKNSSNTLLCRQHETLTDTIWQKWGRLLMVFGVCV